jgi:hypothetical protein
MNTEPEEFKQMLSTILSFSDTVKIIEIPIILEFLLAQIGAARDLASVVREALQFYCEYSSIKAEDIQPSQLTNLLQSNLTSEVEGRSSPAKAFIESIALTDMQPVELQLVSIVDQYLEAVRYTFPALCSFGEHLVTLSCQGRGPKLYLTLRDAISFAPVVCSLAAEDQIRFLNFGRSHAKAKVKPEIFALVPRNKIRVADEPIIKGVITDVGLYGSLVDVLLDKGYAVPEIGASFLASRNSFIYGHLNQMCREVLGSCLGINQIVALADSIEAMLKPWHTQEVADSRVVATLTDPLSFILSCAFSWRLHQYMKSRNGVLHQQREVLDALRLGISNRKAWFLHKAIDPWPAAKQFVSKWKWSFLFPLDQHAGLPPISSDGDYLAMATV